jgi:SAM-dependent methyltransferase
MKNNEIFSQDYIYKGRGLKELAVRVVDITLEIDKLLEMKERVTVLEIGCGFGTALIQLSAKYNNRIRLVGINRSIDDGHEDFFEMNSKKLGIKDGFPSNIEIFYANIDAGIPIPSDSIDLVFSQATWLYLHDKIRALMEVSRVLKHTGFAGIEAFHRPMQNGSEGTLIDIYRSDAKICIDEAFSGLVGIELKHGLESSSVSMRKFIIPIMNFELIDSFSVKKICNNYVGVKSIYRFWP